METFQLLIPQGVDAFQYVSNFATADHEMTLSGNVATVTAPAGTFVCPTATLIA